ncbi:MAG: rRNA pseudouridine synthase [Proteobacteria bacterium]|nr:rRNA pseudouridine synthase [Pseudomonadota bacterium]
MTTERIAKYLSGAGVCSRRDAERMIAEGRVKVNGAVLTTPATQVGPQDTVVVDGKKIANAFAVKPRLWVYHNPAGLVTSHRAEKGRATVFDPLPRDLPRVISVGRLDLDSEGVLLLTNSGALARAMELPQNAQERVYRVRIRGTPMETHYRQLERGVTIDGVKYQPAEVAAERAKEGRNQWLRVTLREGKNREIRRIFEHFDLPVSRLIRVAYGEFDLQDLKPGEVAEVPFACVQKLMQRLGIGD